MKKNTKILICGLGSIGQRHYKNLLSLGYRNIIVYRTKKGSNQGRVDSFSTEYKPVVFTDLDAALFENPEVVFVTNPTSLHVPTALKAAQRGAHLFIEKPISHALDNDLKKLERVVKSKSLKVFVAYQFRFHPLMRKIKEIVNDKKLGNILSVSVMMGERVIDWHPWENYKKSYSSKRDLGGGVVLTQSHDLDYLTWVFGRVKSVKALGGSKGELGIDVEDTVDMLIDFEIGVKALVHLDYVQSPGVRILTLGAATAAISSMTLMAAKLFLLYTVRSPQP